MYAPPEEKNPEQRMFSMTLYVFAAISALLQYFEATVVLGLILLFICFFMVKAQRSTTAGTIYASHAEWTSRTLSIGTFYIFPIAMAVAMYFIYKAVDFPALKKALAASDSDDIGSVINVVKAHVLQNMARVEKITSWCLAPAIFWWIRRCWYGFSRAQRSEPIDYPEGIF